MAAIWTSRTRARQPDHPVGISPTSGDVAGAFLAFPGRMLDLTRRNTGAQTYSGATFGAGAGGFAMNLSGVSSNGLAIPAGGPSMSSDVFSRIAVIRWTGSVSCSISDSQSGVGLGSAQWQIETDGSMNLVKSNVVVVATSLAGAVVVNKTCTVGVTYDGTTARFYVDGRDVTGSSFTSTTFTLNGFLIGAGNSGSNPFTGSIFAHFDWLSSRPRADMLARTANPWQLFAPERKPIFYSLAAGGTTIAVPKGAITVTGNAPTVVATANQSISVPKGAIVLTGFAPTVNAGASQTIAVPKGALTLTGLAPLVAVGGNQSVAVPKGAIALTGYAPTIQNGANRIIDVPAGGLSLTGLAPTILTSGHAYISVPKGALTLTGRAPTVLGGVSSLWTPVETPAATWTAQ